MTFTSFLALILVGHVLGEQFVPGTPLNSQSTQAKAGGSGPRKRQVGAPYLPEEQGLDSDAMKVANKQAELQSLLQQIYQAEAAVKMEAGEVSRTQQVAAESEQALEEAANKVRLLSADLQAAQEAAAQAAMKAHTAQLQLSAHDQLMFTARQRVDALSAQMVSLQAELAAAQQMYALNNSSQQLEAQARLFQNPPSEVVSQYDGGPPVQPQAYQEPYQGASYQDLGYQGLPSYQGTPYQGPYQDAYQGSAYQPTYQEGAMPPWPPPQAPVQPQYPPPDQGQRPLPPNYPYR